ncbi:universal stress protein [Chitinophaga arvensicola]|uniref:Universal stress protein family protein n=1 Tax=Chitinophaga arvensicola TaxID=29529 RepID=A0A1I0S7Q2_9BACT|nr:hypothetical protein [Chitinophaga arvensicola]SEW51732.1 Universal stress protein family protein [Chitinophaga arvensicola]
MKTLLVPVDLNATTLNTVRFAAAWASHYDYQRIILLKTFYDNIFSNIVMSAEYGAVNQDFMQSHREEAMTQLQLLAQTIGSAIKVEIAISEAPLLRAVMEVISEETPEMVLLGSNPGDSDGLVYRNIIPIAKVSPVRVMVVPAGYVYQPVSKALVPVDFQAMHELDKLNKLKASPRWADTRLLVLNVDPEEHYKHPDEEFREVESDLHEYLKNFQHEVFYRNDKDTISSIIDFAATNDIKLIIALPGKHSFLYTLTHKSISEAIYRAATVPVVILK